MVRLSFIVACSVYSRATLAGILLYSTDPDCHEEYFTISVYTRITHALEFIHSNVGEEKKLNSVRTKCKKIYFNFRGRMIKTKKKV